MTPTVSVLVPFAVGAEGSERVDHWRWLRRRYEEDLPDWEIVVGSSDSVAEDFSKGKAVHSAFGRATGEILVIADADCWIHPRGLLDAVEAVDRGTNWVVPHRDVYRLTASTTAKLTAGALEGPPRELPREALYKPMHKGPSGGGLVVLSRQAYTTVGGMDSRFHGWGGDDIAFGWALDTLVGPHTRLSAPIWHLWHYPLVRRTRWRRGNERLAGRYSEANGHPELMRLLIAGAPDDEKWAQKVALTQVA